MLCEQVCHCTVIIDALPPFADPEISIPVFSECSYLGADSFYNGVVILFLGRVVLFGDDKLLAFRCPYSNA